MKGSSLQSLIQLFFTDRLRKQLGVSPADPAVSRGGAQADSARDSGESAAGSTPLHPSATLGNKKSVRPAARTQGITLLGTCAALSTRPGDPIEAA